MTPETLARLAYAANILILAPVVWSLLAHRGEGPLAAFSGAVRNEDGLRLLVTSVWLAVLILSVAGLVWPRPLLALLGFQVVYKACYLALYVVPVWRDRGSSAVPRGVALAFVVIVLLWPVVLSLNFTAERHP